MKPALIAGPLPELETELAEHARDVERFVAQLDSVQVKLHRLTSAATAAALHTELLLGAASEGPGDVAEHGGSLRHALSQMRLLVEELREAARVHPGRGQQLVDGRFVLQRVVEEARTRHSEIEWAMSSPTNDVTFRVGGGEGALDAVLSGVLSSAAGRARTRVEAALRLQMARAQVLFEISHDGESFPWEMLSGDPAAFRIDRAEDGGTPLFDCYRLVRLNGGQFLVENFSGGGGRVRFLLPFAVAASFHEASSVRSAGL